MLSKNSLFSFRLVALVVFALTTGVFAQKAQNAETDKDRTRKAEAYQTQQRALALNSLKTDIKMPDDAPMRCALRYEMAKFFFETKLPLYHDSAVALAIECFEDIEENRNHFSGWQLTWKRTEFLKLLKKYSLADAVRAQKKYLSDARGLSPADTNLSEGDDPKKEADGFISKINGGKVSVSIGVGLDSLKKRDPASANRVINALLSYYEAELHRTYAPDQTFLFFTSELRETTTPLEIRRRFHVLLLRMAEASMGDLENTGLWRVTVDELKYTAADIKEHSPALYERFQGIFNTLSSRKDDKEKEKDEVYHRVEASKDKLAQAVSEAESAKDENFQNELFFYAANLALKQKKYRQCADLNLKNKFYSSNETTSIARDFFLVDSVVKPALKDGDIESAEYVANLVKLIDQRSEANILITERLVELKRMSVARDKLQETLALIDKMEIGQPKVRMMFIAVPVALKIDKAQAFDIASEAVKAINRIPSPSADDKIGTKGRQDYVDKIMVSISYNLDEAFRILGKEDMQLADPIIQGIQLKELRLAAQIALETQRKYPLPPEPTAETKSQ